MSMAPTRFGANDPSMPSVLPSLTSALSRRKAIFGAVALSVAPAAAMPAVSSDAELFALLDRYGPARARFIELSEIADGIMDAAFDARPPKPKALRHRPGDFGPVRGAHLAEGGGDDRWYGRRALAWLINAKPFRRYAGPDRGDHNNMEPDPEAEMRRAEILAAWEGWEADCTAVEVRMGVPAADAAMDAAGEIFEEIETAITKFSARTVPGLAAKAAWIIEREPGSVGSEAWSFAREVAAFGQAA